MTHPGVHADAPRLSADLELLAVETESLLRTARALTDSDVREPSRCAGWTRGHVLTHLARNAESLVRLVVWARTGVRTPQYPSQAARDADIEAGSGRPAAALADDLEATADLVRDALAALALPLAVHELEMSSGPASALALPRRRLNEVVLHHADLDTPWTLADAHPLAVADLLDLAVSRWAPPGGPALRLVSTEGDRYTLGADDSQGSSDDAVTVRGSAADLLLWLTRGTTDGLHSSGPLPTPA